MKMIETHLPVTDRLVREKERLKITSLSRSQAYLLEKEGRFPKRIRLGNRSVCWRLSDLLEWIDMQGECKHEH